MKNKISFLIIFVGLTVLSSCITTEQGKRNEETSKSADYELENQVQKLISEMTPEEKVGQMTQINLNKILIFGDDYSNDEGTISDSALDVAVNKYKVGSILNAINHAYTQETWVGLIKKIQDKTKEGEGVNIPVLYGIDAIHGATFTLGSTLFPHNIGLAATRKVDNATKMAKITAKEVRASGIRWNFDPVFDLGRNPLWSRFSETYGEDPYLVGEMGVAVVTGYEEDGLDSITSVASCMKHFVGYSAPRSGKDRTPAYIPELELREYYLPQFQKAIDAGASSIMINSGELNGIPVHASKYLLTTVLREELGFQGLVVSDWEDINRLHTKHMTASTLKEAVRQGVLAGIDMSMTPHDFIFTEKLIELYNEDEEIKIRVNESVRRILILKGKLGLLDFKTSYAEVDAMANFGKPEYKKEALKVALETMTLLKNTNHTLPLAKSSKILIAGPNANNIPSLHGCWSYTWQGDVYKYKIRDNKANIHADSIISLFPESTVSIKTAFEEMIGKKNVVCRSVSDYDAAVNYRLGNVSGVDAIVLCLGENSYAESPGSIRDLTLDAKQIALAKAAIATGKKVILVLVEGRPRIITEIAVGKNSVDAILQAYLPGSEGSRAIAQTVLGDYNPGGKLPFSYPRSSGDIVPYDFKWTEAGVDLTPNGNSDAGYYPLFPFGHGLSYTEFSYSNFKIDRDTLVGFDTLKITVAVKNTGTVKGDEVVELYSRDVYASVVPNNRRLRRFTRITLNPGEERVVEFKMTANDLKMAIENIDGFSKSYSYDIEEGDFQLMIAGLKFEVMENSDFSEMSKYKYKEALNFYYKR